MGKLLSFHNDPSVKAKYLARLESHHAADEIVKGVRWENGKGCAVGCTIHGSYYSAYEDKLGLPEWYGRLIDCIFQQLPDGASQRFAVDSIGRVPVGIEMERVRHKFSAALMGLNLASVERLPIDPSLKSQSVASIERIKQLHESRVESASEAWAAAESAALSVALSAASVARSADSVALSVAAKAASSASASASALLTVWAAVALSSASVARSADSVALSVAAKAASSASASASALLTVWAAVALSAAAGGPAMWTKIAKLLFESM